MASPKSKGKLVARLLYQAWRAQTPPPQVSEDELASITPLLTGSGAGALAWTRIRESALRDSSSAAELHQAHRLHAIHAAAFEDDIAGVITLLRSAGVDPILAKGWAIARFYPDTSLRPYGDIDLYVRPREYSSASRILASDEGRKYVVDLHQAFDASDGLTTDDLHERSELADLGDVNVRVPCHEDHIRILSLHFLRHGGWRPLWLCDIATAVESRSTGFDWNLCLGGDPRRADWIACCIGLAHELLGADVEDTPVAHRSKNLPGWLISNVLKQWETPYSTNQPPVTHRAAMATYLRHPRGLFDDLQRRWPNPIEATVYTGGPFNEFPRLPFQISECIARTARFVARLPRALRD
jgi:hypothetical protein